MQSSEFSLLPYRILLSLPKIKYRSPAMSIGLSRNMLRKIRRKDSTKEELTQLTTQQRKQESFGDVWKKRSNQVCYCFLVFHGQHTVLTTTLFSYLIEIFGLGFAIWDQCLATWWVIDLFCQTSVISRSPSLLFTLREQE